MNMNRLTKYLDDRLSPDERLSLIVAAHLRKDFAEKERLVRETPRQTWTIPATHPLSEAWFAVAQVEFMEAMSDVMAIHEFSGVGLRADAPDDLARRAIEAADVRRYCLLVRVRAWRRLGRRLGIDALAFWYNLPGWADVRRQIVLARKFAPRRAEVQQILRASVPGVDVGRITTVGHHLARLRKEFRVALGMWKTLADGPPASDVFCSE